MRQLIDTERLRRFMRELGHASGGRGRIYLTGGASAVLFAWRDTTLDIDMDLGPGLDGVLRSIPRLKESLQINVELAAPAQFIPELPGWQDRSPFIAREGTIDFHHYDFYAQALSKIERSHARDIEDVAHMAADGLVDPTRLMMLFEQIEPELFRYPAIDPPSFRRAVERAIDEWKRR